MAKTTGAIRHVHKYYKKHNPNGFRWACMRDGCTHFLPSKSDNPFGYNSICWSCENPFMMGYANLEQDNPVCENCENERDTLAEWLDSKGVTNKTDPIVEAYRKAAKHAETNMPDEIEIIEPDLSEKD